MKLIIRIVLVVLALVAVIALASQWQCQQYTECVVGLEAYKIHNGWEKSSPLYNLMYRKVIKRILHKYKVETKLVETFFYFISVDASIYIAILLSSILIHLTFGNNKKTKID